MNRYYIGIDVDPTKERPFIYSSEQVAQEESCIYRVIEADSFDAARVKFARSLRREENTFLPVTVNEVVESVVDLFGPQGEYLGAIRSSLSMYDVRVQIMKLKLEGYYVRFNRMNYPIDKNGRFTMNPDFFREQAVYLDRLLTQ